MPVSTLIAARAAVQRSIAVFVFLVECQSNLRHDALRPSTRVFVIVFVSQICAWNHLRQLPRVDVDGQDIRRVHLDGLLRKCYAAIDFDFASF